MLRSNWSDALALSSIRTNRFLMKILLLETWWLFAGAIAVEEVIVWGWLNNFEIVHG
jgi:hypothetical protein